MYQSENPSIVINCHTEKCIKTINCELNCPRFDHRPRRVELYFCNRDLL